MLGIDDEDETLEREENIARLAATETALARLEELRGEDWVLDDTVERVSGAYRYRQRRFTARVPDGEFDGGLDGDGIDYEARSAAYQRLMRELLNAQRETLIELRDRGEINDDVMRRIELELDLEDARLEI
jgi:CPA1 family monovalent cation:H+ antiporter